VEISQKKITELVDENYVSANVLYYFGIQFYEYSENTLAQVCSQKGLNLSHVVRRLESASAAGPSAPVSVEELPVDLIIEYLKHAHYIFIKQRLPYIARLIEKLDVRIAPPVRDLQLVFPLFVEDFIYHIYEEEDTLFTYIMLLNSAKNRRFNTGKLYFEMEKYSIQKFAVAHETHDDEMQGIRNITNGYALEPQMNLHLKVVFSELKAFEEDLQVHARIEDEIMFPKALSLEAEVKKMVGQIIAAS
jgi:regulator of cell morphogenesis and NO signaling